MINFAISFLRFKFFRRERSTDQVNKPVNLDALYKWVDYIPDDVKRDMAKIAPALKMMGYDPAANPPKYGDPDAIVRNTTDYRHQRTAN